MTRITGPEVLRTWREHPDLFVRKVFAVEPDPWQLDVLAAFASNDPADMRIALQACVGVGKGAVMAWCGWNFMLTHGGLTARPQGACIAPTEKQLKAALWKEYALWYSRPTAEVLRESFTMTSEAIRSREHPLTWFFEARAYPKDADAEQMGQTLSGIHATDVLIQIDESATVPPVMLLKAEQARSSAKWWKLMQAANPTSRDGCLYAAVTKYRADWRVFRITGDPDDPNRSARIPLDMAREKIRSEGRTDWWVMAHILGEFPPGGINTLLTPDQVDDAMRRAPRAEEFDWAAKVIGLDVARFGLDDTAMARRQGRMVWPLWIAHGLDGVQGAGHTARTWQDWKADACFIDDTGGYGASWIDQLRVLGFAPVGVQFAGEPRDKRFLNKRAEMWFEMAEWVKSGGALPPDQVLARDLSNVHYGFKGDRIKLEEKDEIRKRLGFSPDRGDAVALTFAFPVQASRGPMADLLRPGGINGPQMAVMELETDPFAERRYMPEPARTWDFR